RPGTVWSVRWGVSTSQPPASRSRVVARSRSCSSVRSKSMAGSQSENGRGDDGALHLVGAPVDGGLAVVEVTRCGELRPLRRGDVVAGGVRQRIGPGDLDRQLGDRLLQLAAA